MDPLPTSPEALFKISKLDAARRQLQAAVSLYFDSADPVPVHTLAHATFGILDDLCKHSNSHQSFVDQFLDTVRDDKKSFVRRKLNEAGNFFKHADRDPESTLEFRPGATEWLIFDCCVTYQSLSGEQTAWTVGFLTWMSLRNPGVLEEPFHSSLKEISSSTNYGQMPKREFFDSIWEAWRFKEATRRK